MTEINSGISTTKQDIEAIIEEFPIEKRRHFLSALKYAAAAVHVGRMFGDEQAPYHAGPSMAECVFQMTEEALPHIDQQALRHFYEMIGMEPTLEFDRPMIDFTVLLEDIQKGDLLKYMRLEEGDEKVDQDILLHLSNAAQSARKASLYQGDSMPWLECQHAAQSLSIAMHHIYRRSSPAKAGDNFLQLEDALGFRLIVVCIDLQNLQAIEMQVKEMLDALERLEADLSADYVFLPESAQNASERKWVIEKLKTVQAFFHGILRRIFGAVD